MKSMVQVIIWLFFLSSCRHDVSLQYQKKQDSLLSILHDQVAYLRTLSNSYTKHFSIPDSLSTTDSLLYYAILTNHTKARTILDSIQAIIPQVIAESDTLFKHHKVYDTSLINRSQYLIMCNKTYIEEYHRASAIAEQNEKLLEIFTASSAQR